LREQLQQRLEELKKEFETGQARLREVEMQEARLRETLLRISGAIQVLEEALAAESDAGADDGRQGADAAQGNSGD
jgi:predicted nuclease with TOPRIM domain